MHEPEIDFDPLRQALGIASADSIERVLERSMDCILTEIPATRCTIWWAERTRNGFSMRLSRGGPSERDLAPPLFIPFDTAQAAGILDMDWPGELRPNALVQLPFLSGCMVARIYFDEQTSGIIAAAKFGTELWHDKEKTVLAAVSGAASSACCHLDHLNKTTQLSHTLHALSEAIYDNQVHQIAVTDGKLLLDCDRALVRRINLKTGELELVRSSPKPEKIFSLASGEGIVGLALQERKIFKVDDVTTEEWRERYRPLWHGSRSELAAPILLPQARARIGTKIEFVERPFGVVNFESPLVAAFSSFHKQCAVSITQQIALILEKIEFDRKIGRLRAVENKLASIRDWDSLADNVMAEIRDTLGYEYVSFSTVDREAGVIRCLKVVGVSNPDEFRRAAIHKLDGSNIQAGVVRARQAEVPAPGDPRFDPELSERFGLDHLIRVFIPIISASQDEVVGTLVAGYDRQHRPYIYERDVQLLKGFVTFANSVLEVRRRGVITRVSHEMNAPLTAIRNNLAWLQRRRRMMAETHVDLVLEDMITDAEILHHQVERLEFLWAGRISSKPKVRIEPVDIFRDIIFKTINQLKSMVREKNLDPARVTYDMEDAQKIRTVHVDKGKLGQVIFNLFVNAVKYSESPETFQIRIGAEERPDCYVIKFRDWGIGVPAGLEEKIFTEWFRAPAASQSDVSGSGLGLTISRQLMREHGGDLVLAHRSKPTEFHVLIPKRVVEKT